MTPLNSKIIKKKLFKQSHFCNLTKVEIFLKNIKNGKKSKKQKSWKKFFFVTKIPNIFYF